MLSGYPFWASFSFLVTAFELHTSIRLLFWFLSGYSLELQAPLKLPLLSPIFLSGYHIWLHIPLWLPLLRSIFNSGNHFLLHIPFQLPLLSSIQLFGYQYALFPSVCHFWQPNITRLRKYGFFPFFLPLTDVQSMPQWSEKPSS